MKLKYLWLAATATYASAQNEASFSGISADSAISIIEEQTEDLSDANYTTVRLEAVGHSNGDFFFLHDYPSSQFDGQTLSLNVNALQFTRDAEYFLPETKGYTAVGFFLTPTLKFRTRSWESFNVEAGAQVLGIAGDDHRLHVKPVFRIEYEPNEWLRLVGGTIYGNVNHGLYEPMYDFDRFFYNNQEDGLQLMIFKNWEHFRFTSDTWLNWENFLEPGEAEQEKFTIGCSNRLMFGSATHKCFQIPIDIMGTHRGGQFSALQDTCLETLFNAATGVDWAINTHWRLTAMAFGYKNNSNEMYTHFKSGYGLYPMAAYYNKNFALFGGYWYGNGYIGARGSHLFMSVSKYDPLFEQKERNMITGKWFYQHGIFGLEAQAYYDLKESKCDFSFGLYMKFNKDFGLMSRNL